MKQLKPTRLFAIRADEAAEREDPIGSGLECVGLVLMSEPVFSTVDWNRLLPSKRTAILEEKYFINYEEPDVYNELTPIESGLSLLRANGFEDDNVLILKPTVSNEDV